MIQAGPYECVFKVPLALPEWVRGLRREHRASPENLQVGVRPLSVDMQDGEPVLWYLCIPEQMTRLMVIHVIGTGAVVPDGAEFCGTVQEPPYVWHVWLDRRGTDEPGGSK